MKYKIQIISYGQVWGDPFREVDEEGKLYIEKAALEGKWGRQQRTQLDSPLSPISDEEKASAISSKVIDGITEYTFAKEYEIIVEDITAAYEAEQLAIKTDREQRDLDNAEVKGMLTWIKDHPTMEAKLKKILKVLIKETLK